MKSNGESVFPYCFEIESAGQPAVFIEKGMTLLDYFAGQALMGFCANPKCLSIDNETIAQWSWFAAKAMLAEREKKG